MRRFRISRRLLLPAALLAALLAAVPQPARADQTFEDFLWLLDQTHVFPVSSQDVKSSKGFLDCLSNADTDTEVIACVDSFKDTPLGKQAASGTGAPSWFWDLIDAYVAYRTGDFWGVVGKLGEAALCFVAQVMTGGAADVCGLIEQLVALAEEFEDAAKAVAKFVASVGGATYEVIKSIGCSLGLGGCSKGSPPEQLAYAFVFQPEIPAGVAEMEKTDKSAFPAFRKQLELDAGAKPYAKLHIQGGGVMNLSFGASAVNIASGAYTAAVEKNWSVDVAKNVLPALAKKRAEYDNPQQVAALAAMAASAVSQSPGVTPAAFVENRCTDDFSQGFGFAHVDRWIQQFPQEAKSLKDVQTNRVWCGNTFWGKNREKFAQHFRDYLKMHSCPLFGQSLLCVKIESYNLCLGLLGSVGHKNECGVAVGAVGKEAAEKIAKSFKDRGSRIPCKIRADATPVSQKPADFVCTRPPQRHACEETYKGLFGALPVKLVNCLVENTPRDYATLVGKVATAADALKAEFGATSIGIDLIDPLVVRVSSAGIVGKVQAKNPGYGFGKPSDKPGFDYTNFAIPRPVDGVSTPVLGFESAAAVKQFGIQDKLKEKLATVKPGDPDPYGKTSTTLGSPGALQAAPGALPAPSMPKGVQGPAPAPTQGKLPTEGGRTASSPDARPPAAAEIRSGPNVMVAGKYPAVWGQGITVSGTDARRAAGGVCDVAVKHGTINAGAAASGPFARRWVNSRNPAPFTDTYPSIPPGGTEPRTDTLPLKPGANELTLTLDSLGQVKESNEGNNVYRVTVTVTGSCGAAGPPPPGGAPPGSIPPAKRPETRGR